MPRTKEDMQKFIADFCKVMTTKLKGKTIQAVEYLTDEEMEGNGWYKRPPVIVFTDGSWMVAQMDGEGNDGGVITFVDEKGESTLLGSM